MMTRILFLCMVLLGVASARAQPVASTPPGLLRMLAWLHAVDVSSSATVSANLNWRGSGFIFGMNLQTTGGGFLTTKCTGITGTPAGQFWFDSGKTIAASNSIALTTLTGTTVALKSPFASGFNQTLVTYRTIYFAMATPNAGAATCDFYLYGIEVP